MEGMVKFVNDAAGMLAEQWIGRNRVRPQGALEKILDATIGLSEIDYQAKKSMTAYNIKAIAFNLLTAGVAYHLFMAIVLANPFHLIPAGILFAFRHIVQVAMDKSFFSPPHGQFDYIFRPLV